MANFIVGLIALLAVVTGLGIISEGSLPGSLLYPIKIQGTEELRDALALGSAAEARWDVRRFERRLEEAERLLRFDGFDLATEQELKEELQKQLSSILDDIASLRRVGKIETSLATAITLEAIITGHIKVLALLDETFLDRVPRMYARDILAELEGHRDATVALRGELETTLLADNLITERTVRERLDAALRVIASVEAMGDRNDLPEETRDLLEAGLNGARDSVEKGRSHFREKSWNEAFSYFQNSVRLGAEARVLLGAGIASRGFATARRAEGEGRQVVEAENIGEVDFELHDGGLEETGIGGSDDEYLDQDSGGAELEGIVQPKVMF